MWHLKVNLVLLVYWIFQKRSNASARRKRWDCLKAACLLAMERSSIEDIKIKHILGYSDR